jgi:hypothetical protein
MATKVSKVGNNFYSTSVTTNTDGSLKATTSKTDAQGNNGVPVTSSTVTGGVLKFTPESGATAAETAAFNNPASEERKAYTNQVQSQNPYGPNPNAAQKQAVNGIAGNPNAATNSPTPPSQAASPATPEQSADAAAAAKEVGSTKDGTRTSYATNMKYPINLQSEVQDVIKFSILEYSPSLAAGNQGKNRIVILEGNNPIIKGSKRIGVITLPIPAGISDSNPVGWQSDTINDLQKAAGDAANIFLSGGTAEESIEPGAKLAKQGSSPEGKDAVRSIFTGLAGQSGGLSQRTQGAILNNNVELLFSGPSLRSFSFQFLFYPREPNEAKMVRQIIRAFKQAMSVKRSSTSLLLKSPHTFAISYMTAGQKAHPYLNRFKECALTSCNVEYTPDGTYMTYGGQEPNDEKSMTAYRLSLTFQELEPLFDDEYGDDDNNIGF